MWHLKRVFTSIFLVNLLSSSSSSPIACLDKCGNLTVTFPLGTGPGCGHPDFASHLTCTQQAYALTTPSGTYAVSSVDYDSATITLADPTMSTCGTMQNSGSFVLDPSAPFALASDTTFVLLGCSTTSPVFNPSLDLCATGSPTRLCEALYSCKGVTGIGLSERGPTSSCCVFQPPIEDDSFRLDLPMLQCSSFAAIHGFGSDRGDPAKWEYGVSLKFNSSYVSDECKDCSESRGICGYRVENRGFTCVCPNGKNNTNNCLGRGYGSSSGSIMQSNKIAIAAGLFFFWWMFT